MKTSVITHNCHGSGKCHFISACSAENNLFTLAVNISDAGMMKGKDRQLPKRDKSRLNHWTVTTGPELGPVHSPEIVLSLHSQK